MCMAEWNPFESGPVTESVAVGGARLRVGDRVRLRPRHSADIMDLVLANKVAIIEAIERDFDGDIQFGVVLEEDPGRDFGELRQPGHRFFFRADEVDIIAGAEVLETPCNDEPDSKSTERRL